MHGHACDFHAWRFQCVFPCGLCGAKSAQANINSSSKINRGLQAFADVKLGKASGKKQVPVMSLNFSLISFCAAYIFGL